MKVNKENVIHKLKIVLIYLIYYVCTKISLFNIDNIIFHEKKEQIYYYILVISILNLLSFLLIKKWNLNKNHLLILLLIDIYLVSPTMLIGNLPGIVTIIYFIISCTFYYKLNKSKNFN